LGAVQALLAWQLAATPAGGVPRLDAVLLRQAQAGFAEQYLVQLRQQKLAPEWQKLLQQAFDALAALMLDQAQLPLQQPPAPFAAMRGPISWDLAALTRNPELPWDEEHALDLSVRYWQQGRAAGLALAEDFGEFYRALEWTGVQQHLAAMGALAAQPGATESPAIRHLGQWVRAGAGRYRELKVLQRLVEQAEGIAEASGYAFGRV
jgi:aminoglycoside/choline kinase family phosphotransferase